MRYSLNVLIIYIDDIIDVLISEGSCDEDWSNDCHPRFTVKSFPSQSVTFVYLFLKFPSVCNFVSFIFWVHIINKPDLHLDPTLVGLRVHPLYKSSKKLLKFT